jgi:hypothetical protein
VDEQVSQVPDGLDVLEGLFEIAEERPVVLESEPAHVLDLSQKDRQIQFMDEEWPDKMVAPSQQQVEEGLQLMLQCRVLDGQLADPGE